MADPTPPSARRRRRWPIAISVFAALIAVAAFAAHRFMRAENLTALLIGQTRGTLGAELILDGVARFAFWPALRLHLPKPRLRAPASNNLLANADAIDIALPWHTLWHARIDIESIELVHPVLDLDAWSAWRANLPAGGAAPDVRFAVRIEDGEVRSAGTVIASGIAATFANSGDLGAWFERMRADAANALTLPPLHGSLDAQSLDIGATHIKGLKVEISEDPLPTSPSKQPR